MGYKAVVIGSGSIGGELLSRLAAMDTVVKAVVTSQNVFFPQGEPYTGVIPNSYKGQTEEEKIRIAFGMTEEDRPDVVFLTIPTLDEGRTALRYIEAILERGCKVVTCEKGALAYHFGTLRPKLPKIGYRATVGGGTMMIPALRIRQLSGKRVTVHAVVNGTLNYIFAGVALAGRPLADMVREAASLKYTEPGAYDPLTVISEEIKDVRMKLSVLFNTTFADGADDQHLHPSDFIGTRILYSDLLTFTDPSAGYRYLTRITNDDGPYLVREGSPGSLVAKVGRWRIEGGFINVFQGTEIARWFPSGVNNAAMVKIGHHGDVGVYEICRGPGAGPVATAEAMLADARDLIGVR